MLFFFDDVIVATYHDLLELVLLDEDQRIEKVLLDVVLERVLDAGHLTQRLARVVERMAEHGLVAQVLAVLDHRLAESALRLRIRRALHVAAHLRQVVHRPQLGSRRCVHSVSHFTLNEMEWKTK